MSVGTGELRQVGAAHPDIRQALVAARGREPGSLLITGIWAHQAALDAGVVVDAFLCAPELLHSPEALTIADRMIRTAERSHRVSTKIIRRLSDQVGVRADGLAAVIRPPQWRADRLRIRPDPLIVIADGLQSPGNLGSVIRTIDASGADLLLITNQRTRPNSAKVFLGSRGRSLTTPYAVFPDTDDAIVWLRERSVRVLVTDANAGPIHSAVDYAGPTAIVLGNERRGVSEPWRSFERIRIPMLGRADSLNVAVTAGIVLYQARAQRDGW